MSVLGEAVQIPARAARAVRMSASWRSAIPASQWHRWLFQSACSCAAGVCVFHDMGPASCDDHPTFSGVGRSAASAL
eukprot:11508846-Alexandrium_andersonii.AAC.5